MAPILHHNQSHNQYETCRSENGSNAAWKSSLQGTSPRRSQGGWSASSSSQSFIVIVILIIQSFIVTGIIFLWHHSHPTLLLLVSFVIAILIIQSFIVIGIIFLWHQVLAAVRRGLTGHPLDLRGSRRALEAAQVFIFIIAIIIIIFFVVTS